MTYLRSANPPRLLTFLGLAALAACSQRAPPQSAPPRPSPAAASIAGGGVDKFQAMAFEAGRDLVGRRAPRLSFKTLDGRTVRVGETGGPRPIYLKFWATWCVTCREQMESFKSDFARYGRDIDVVAVDTGVNDDLQAVEAYRRDVGLTMPIAIDDGRLAEGFHLKVTPQHIIIGRDGRVRYVGHLEDARLHEEIEAAIANTAPTSPGGERALPDAVETGTAPIGDLTSVQGTRVRIDGPAAGAPRLLFFLSPWCETYLKDSRPVVAQECQTMREALMRAADAGQARVIGIASGLSTDADGARRYLQRTGFQAPVVMDGDGALFRRFGVRSFPAVIRLDVQGRPAGRLTAAGIDALARRPSA